MSSLSEAGSQVPGSGFFARIGVSQIAADLRARRVTAPDLTDIALAEAERWQPAINAFVDLDAFNARRAARVVARELAQGIDRGPLHGVPVAIKDVIDVQGMPTTAGSRVTDRRLADADAEAVRALRQAGAIVIGKTTTHEFANGPTGDRAATGPTRNPHRQDRMAGGSSSGSAAAVAAGVVPVALGTDTGGSARIPASMCGVVGLRPTQGALSVVGVYALAPSLDTIGLLSRDLDGCRFLWHALGRPRSGPAHPSSTVAWVRPDSIHATEPSVTRRSRALVDHLIVDELDLQGADELHAAYRVIQGREAYLRHAESLRTLPSLYDPEVLERFQQGGRVSETEYIQALNLGRLARRRTLGLLRKHGVLALPSVPLLPPAINSRVESVAGVKVEVRSALLALTSPWSVMGLPAISVPAGEVDGLPVGLQLVGPPGAEPHLLQLAATLESAG
ncbi:amidase [Micromonospora inyonensis]|uniref:Aspartyl-tRNA(Asn)/glutamyl-tRNA(Gln) amidotransferase subunit A n=1 Tax=Micromonospora inyonensis TaxID=47866 RepID=A0A1C6S6F6_9ACTN|nr:amidase [Micromonospora inyonensis]SCL25055.1 aspartyl-tRNA(Asn)/glutamyl-tRNA(Gln) amidotransferase subunit A [Micromonospora inyonensis]